jgi:hypothetical protein
MNKKKPLNLLKDAHCSFPQSSPFVVNFGMDLIIVDCQQLYSIRLLSSG